MAAGVLTVKLDRQSSVLDSLAITNITGCEITFPSEFSAPDLDKSRRDSELFADLVRRHPKEVNEIVNQCLSSNAHTVRDLAMQIGLTEESFQSEGGGFPWVVVDSGRGSSVA